VADKNRDIAGMAKQMGVSEAEFRRSEAANKARVQEKVLESVNLHAKASPPATTEEPSTMDRLKGMIKDAFSEATQVVQATMKAAVNMDGSIEQTVDAVRRGNTNDSETNRRVAKQLQQAGLEP